MRKFTSFLLTAVLSCSLLVGQVCSATTLGGVDQSTYRGYKVGDINNNGKTDSADVLKVKQLVLEGASAQAVPAADLNKDGKINSLDVMILKDKLMNIDDSTASSISILLDAGHFGKYNKYAGIDYYESQFTWELYKALREELQSYGFVVHGTRTSQNNLLLSSAYAVTGEKSYTKYTDMTNKVTRSNYANNNYITFNRNESYTPYGNSNSLRGRGLQCQGYDLFLSLHSNITRDPQAPACEKEYSDKSQVDAPVAVCLYKDSSITGDEISWEVGQKLVDTIAKTMGTKQSGVVQQKTSSSTRTTTYSNNKEYFRILSYAHYWDVPAILLEHSYHTNPTSAKWLSNPTNVKKLAKAEAYTIAKYYGVVS